MLNQTQRTCTLSRMWANRFSGAIWFTNSKKNVCRMIVDSKDRIVNFPGIAQREEIEKHIKNGSLEEMVKFTIDFECAEKYPFIVLWTVQPDGRYWGDDGFGMENDEEIVLYSYLDESGNYVSPFRLYRIGRTRFAKKT